MHFEIATFNLHKTFFLPKETIHSHYKSPFLFPPLPKGDRGIFYKGKSYFSILK